MPLPYVMLINHVTNNNYMAQNFYIFFFHEISFFKKNYLMKFLRCSKADKKRVIIILYTIYIIHVYNILSCT